MAKFTVFFKDKPVQSAIFDAGVVHIGRDDTNDLVVDSLAVAPAHAAVMIKDGSYIIKQLNEKFPLLVNQLPVKEWSLKNNDVVNVGKHYIVFHETESIPDQTYAQLKAVLQDDPDLDALNQKLEASSKHQEANLQVMDGPHIGRILPLKKAMTRLGREGGGVIVIAKRKDGYYLSALQGHAALSVNRQPLGDRIILLQHNDVIEVDNVPMQFFLQ